MHTNVRIGQCGWTPKRGRNIEKKHEGVETADSRPPRAGGQQGERAYQGDGEIQTTHQSASQYDNITNIK